MSAELISLAPHPDIDDAATVPAAWQLDELERRLDTERSANRAMIAVIAELETAAQKQQAQCERMQRDAINFVARLRELETELAVEVTKPMWRKLLQR